MLQFSAWIGKSDVYVFSIFNEINLSNFSGSYFCPSQLLKCFRAAFAGSDAYCLFDVTNKNLSIPDLVSFSCLDYGFNCGSTWSSSSATSIFTFVKNPPHTLRHDKVLYVLWRPKPLTSITDRPWTPISWRASFTSSNLNGFIIASFSW